MSEARVQEKIGALAAKRKTNKTVVKFNVDKKEIDFTPTNPYLNSIVTRKNVNGLRKTAKTEERAQSPIHELPQPQNFIPASKGAFSSILLKAKLFFLSQCLSKNNQIDI